MLLQCMGKNNQHWIKFWLQSTNFQLRIHNCKIANLSISNLCNFMMKHNLSNGKGFVYDTKINHAQRSFHRLTVNPYLSLTVNKTYPLQRMHTSIFCLGKNIDKSRVPILNEEDLEESFVRGSGPGGQSVNKTSSACVIKHIPTGFVVKCHEQRSLQRNRVRARQLMINKLDIHFNGEMSVEAQHKRIQDVKNSKALKKSLKRESMKKAWKEREGIE
ncbi:peptide chain release factor 1 [Cherax quadricarinatus]|nr:peptide chain release factor 1-like [Cherax quadricarinatus]